MVVGVLEVCLAVPAATLKEKRSVVRRVVSRTRQRFNVSVAEVDEQDVPSSAVIGIVTVSASRSVVDRLFQKVEDAIEEMHLCEVTGSSQVIETF